MFWGPEPKTQNPNSGLRSEISGFMAGLLEFARHGCGGSWQKLVHRPSEGYPGLRV